MITVVICMSPRRVCMKFTVNMLLTCIPYCDGWPAVIRTVCKYNRQILITDIMFVLVHFSSETP